MKRLTQTLAFCLLTAFTAVAQKNYVSEVWVSDLGNGKYKNPVLYADYSDPDACRVGDDFYMTSSSFNCLPGLQILHSKDLVNWTIIGAAVPNALTPIETPERPEHGNRIWAPAIRYHNGEFYIFWGDPDQGAFMVKAKDPKGPWSEPVLVKPGKGIIDTCPFWDEDGKVYMVHAYAGSRAGLKSVITICELNAEATKATTPSRIIFDGHEAHQTCEGPKMYKRNDYYYIFHPAGGVPTGWQVVLRSKNIYGPYEWKTVLAQGNSPVNGPHQGAWVTGMQVDLVYANGMRRDVTKYVQWSEDPLTEEDAAIDIRFPYVRYHDQDSEESGRLTNVKTQTPVASVQLTVEPGTAESGRIGTLTWAYDIESGTLTISGEFEDGQKLAVAYYDQNGHLAQVKLLTQVQTLALVENGARIRLFLLDKTNQPVCKVMTVKG